MNEYDIRIVTTKEVTDSILLELSRPKHDINSLKHLRECFACDQLQGKLEDDAREEAENE